MSILGLGIFQTVFYTPIWLRDVFRSASMKHRFVCDYTDLTHLPLGKMAAISPDNIFMKDNFCISIQI